MGGGRGKVDSLLFTSAQARAASYTVGIYTDCSLVLLLHFDRSGHILLATLHNSNWGAIMVQFAQSSGDAVELALV